MNYCINRIIQHGRRKQCLNSFFLTAAVLAIAAGAGIHSFIRKKRLRKQALREKYGKIPPIGAWDERAGAGRLGG